MTIKPLILTAFEISGVPALDPIRVYLQYFGNGQGRLTIECYGRSWANYWGAMGTDIRTFLIEASTEYIENALHTASCQKPRKADRDYLQRIVVAVQEALALPDPPDPEPSRLVVQHDPDGMVFFCHEDRELHEHSEAERTDMGLRRLELADLDKECRVEKGSYVVIPFHPRTRP